MFNVNFQCVMESAVFTDMEWYEFLVKGHCLFFLKCDVRPIFAALPNRFGSSLLFTINNYQLIQFKKTG